VAKRKVKRRAVLATYIYDTLRQDISGGEFEVGSNVSSENELCKRFKASRMTVRSALKRLAADGFIKSIPGRGWQVTSSSPRRRPGVAKPVLLSGSTSTDATVCLEAARKTLTKFGYDTRIHTKSRDASLGKIEWDKISGVVFYSGVPVDQKLVDRAAKAKVPIVCAMLSQQEEYDTVSCDHQTSTAECMEYLIGKGMKRIGYLSNRYLEDDSDDPSFRQRRRAYDAAMSGLGLEPMVFLSKYNHAIGFEEGDRFADWLKGFKKKGKPLDALFVTVKPLVEFALWQLHTHGLSAKTDVKVIGATEAIPMSLLQKHGLKKITLVRAPYEAIGELAAKRISERIDGDDGPAQCTLLKSVVKDIEGDNEEFPGA